jgi:hypothetical protein
MTSADEARQLDQMRKERKEQERREDRERKERKRQEQEEAKMAREMEREEARLIREAERERAAENKREHKQDSEAAKEMRRLTAERVARDKKRARNEEVASRKRQRILQSKMRGMTAGAQTDDDIGSHLLSAGSHADEDEANLRMADARILLGEAVDNKTEEDDWYPSCSAWGAIAPDDTSVLTTRPPPVREEKQQLLIYQPPPPPPPPAPDSGDDEDGDGEGEGDREGDEAEEDNSHNHEEEEEGEGEGEDDEDDEAKQPENRDVGPLDALAAALAVPDGNADDDAGNIAPGPLDDYVAIPLEGIVVNWTAGMTAEEAAKEAKACMPDKELGNTVYCVLCLCEPWSADAQSQESGEMSPLGSFFQYIDQLIRNAVGFENRIKLIRSYVHRRLRTHLPFRYQTKWQALAVLAAHYNSHDLSARAVVEKGLRLLTVLEHKLATTGVMVRERTTGNERMDLNAAKTLASFIEKRMSMALRHETLLFKQTRRK